MVPWVHPSPYQKWHLNQFSGFCSAHCSAHSHNRQTDWPTDCVCSNRPHLASAAMWPNNTRQKCERYHSRIRQLSDESIHACLAFSIADVHACMTSAAEHKHLQVFGADCLTELELLIPLILLNLNLKADLQCHSMPLIIFWHLVR